MLPLHLCMYLWYLPVYCNFLFIFLFIYFSYLVKPFQNEKSHALKYFWTTIVKLLFSSFFFFCLSGHVLRNCLAFWVSILWGIHLIWSRWWKRKWIHTFPSRYVWIWHPIQKIFLWERVTGKKVLFCLLPMFIVNFHNRIVIIIKL